jgi:ABC-type multidrug transport system fused ATPase/permease subunit
MIIRSVTDFETSLTSVERIKEYIDLPHEPEWEVKEKKPKSDWPNNGVIRFVNYSLKYREELDNVLSNLNVETKPSEKANKF